jgi:hypothetical protein
MQGLVGVILFCMRGTLHGYELLLSRSSLRISLKQSWPSGPSTLRSPNRGEEGQRTRFLLSHITVTFRSRGLAGQIIVDSS